MNRRDLPTLLADLDDLRARAADAGVGDRVLGPLLSARLALYLLNESRSEPEHERPSYPPSLLDENQPKRRSAVEHFRKAREHTSEAVRRLRRGQ